SRLLAADRAVPRARHSSAPAVGLPAASGQPGAALLGRGAHRPRRMDAGGFRFLVLLRRRPRRSAVGPLLPRPGRRALPGRDRPARVHGLGEHRTTGAMVSPRAPRGRSHRAHAARATCEHLVSAGRARSTDPWADLKRALGSGPVWNILPGA